jgi:hypothetical protein
MKAMPSHGIRLLLALGEAENVGFLLVAMLSVSVG